MAKIRAMIEKNHGTSRGYIRVLLGQTEYLFGRLEPFLEIRPDRVSRLVFVCLGNINRSAFAQGVARQHGVRASSFGLSTSTGQPAFPLAIETASRFNVDLSSHVTLDVKKYQYIKGDLLLAMEVRHARRLLDAGFPPEAVKLLGNWATPHRIHIHDPHTLSREYFCTCFTLIHSAIVNLVEQLATKNSPCISRKIDESVPHV